nr:hypothetical protein CFP56_09530 [Quercus suber]
MLLNQTLRCRCSVMHVPRSQAMAGWKDTSIAATAPNMRSKHQAVAAATTVNSEERNRCRAHVRFISAFSGSIVGYVTGRTDLAGGGPKRCF